ncbi:2-oxo-4-hydroxy-4-carboxy-5-ureidoimidazoline decarboxylase [Rhodococcus sp. ACPA4]|uniref:2-oxo-4-hydroxy-4-carboxy-5-ureidoimidazoline decarboxylase n=1 Tax=Rhodococcus TaxID=1827 RepID=UPI0005D2E29D|nr:MULTISPECIES: 2-oxo-4-hydroxy-4-carboxy-5-ureidoimidazoline decarboxylase [unclassified Rhodococcus (in: high G+C Gram-positive bacteria)]KJF20588.1 putative OHCU decarboxylase [Rhodococcus sp. AD45]PBC37108.1 2-oxo-4-hydroxy-4-carboxy-5-ureidoimidazoline decarboxylase [Rhodococcus sp. ACPA4]PSR38199.1 2-oxo-4-hydroxy-4-carboxy-5-ureidoimidazoline decarboxylase [Rhodococcus sp. AD45-ID]ROZ44598.1 2-oxo-4-hydroxy-4-carboxy-5-ureidoimidazoline decarboxylase [Rhodococcus sp. WS3]
MLLHQSIGLERFNELPRPKAIHALYECCCSMTWAGWVSDGRPFASYAEILARAENALLNLSDADVENALHCHPPVGVRAQSVPSHLEQCAIWDSDESLMATIRRAGEEYESTFAFRYIWCSHGHDAQDLLENIRVRLTNPASVERKICVDELAKITCTRIERMLGPEDGYPEY